MAVTMVTKNGVARGKEIMAIPGGMLSRGGAGESWIAMRAHIVANGGPAIAPKGPISSFRNYAGQVKMRQYWCGQGQCGKAAPPGTSNHGWGTAVDVRPQDESWLLKIGPRFGWSHAEGARVNESWHFTYVGGWRPDPLRFLTRGERELVRRLEHHRNGMREEALTGRGPRWRAHLEAAREYKAQVIARRKSIWRTAKESGWSRNRRRERYRTLMQYARGG